MSLDFSEPVADFSYYEAKNQNQIDFHKSKAKNKLLIGAYRSGKTYPAIHEALFICGDNPGHEFCIFRNTEESLRTNIQKDFIAVAREANAIKHESISKKEVILWNDCKVLFRPLTLKREQLKGMNLCGFLIDDPDVNRYKEVIAFLFTRLTDPPTVKAKYFATIICANYEGHDWLWQKYMRRREQGGDDRFAYWICATADNPTLDPDYIETQKALRSEAWMKKYIEGDTSGYSGLVYSEYEPQYHDGELDWCVEDHSLIKILIVDFGITHPSVILKAACDYNNVFFYDEWYRVNVRTKDVAEKILERLSSGEHFRKVIVDPKANAREQQSGVSTMNILKKDYGIRNLKNGDNAMGSGIEFMKGLLTVRLDDKDKDKIDTHFFVDPKKCPHLVDELESLPWIKTEYSKSDELGYKEEAQDIDNDSTDCARYGCAFFKKFLRNIKRKEHRLEEMIRAHREERFKKLPFYQGNEDAIKQERGEMNREMYRNRININKNRNTDIARVVINL